MSCSALLLVHYLFLQIMFLLSYQNAVSECEGEKHWEKKEGNLALKSLRGLTLLEKAHIQSHVRATTMLKCPGARL